MTIAGVVRLSEGVLVSPLGKKRCAYYGLHQNLLTGVPVQEQARDFIVEDQSGRALVVMSDYEVAVATERRKQAVTSLDADIHELSDRLRELKDQMRDNPGPAQTAIRAELQRGRELATLLCALQAHARGKLHAHKSLADQERYIMSTSARWSAADREQRLLMLNQYEACLEEGQRVLVSGVATWEPDPSRALGYRDQAKLLVLRAPPGARLTIRTPRVVVPAVPTPSRTLRFEPHGFRSAFTFMAALVVTIVLLGLTRYCG